MYALNILNGQGDNRQKLSHREERRVVSLGKAIGNRVGYIMHLRSIRKASAERHPLCFIDGEWM